MLLSDRGRLTTAAALAAGLVALGLLAWVGLAAASTRYWSDDYCFASMARQHGILGAQAAWYQEWTGRFTATAVMTVLTSLPVKVAAWTLPLLLVAWVATLAWTMLQAIPSGGEDSRPTAIAVAGALAAAIVVVTVAIVPTRAQVVDWLTGAVAYVLPLVLATPIAGLVLRAVRRGGAGSGSVALAGGLALLAAGCSESFTGTELAGLGLVAAAAVLPTRLRPTRRVAVVALFGAVAGFFIVLLAPGNAERLAALHTHGQPGYLLEPTLHFGARVVGTFISLTPVPLLLALVAGAAAAVALPSPPALRRPVATVLIAFGAGAALVYAAMAPATYYRLQPPDRALLGTAELMALGAAGAGFVLGSALRRSVRFTGALALLAAGVLLVVTYPAQAAPLDDLRSAGSTASAWDRRDATIRAAAAAGSPSVVVPRLTSGALVDDFEDPGVRNCAQIYYGVQVAVR